MKFLITVSSCRHDALVGDHKALRDTWGRIADERGVPYIITMGSGPCSEHEVSADCPDDWLNLPTKTLFNIRYALEHDYDYVFQCFRDTYISIPRLLKAWEDVQPSGSEVIGNFYYHGVYEGHPCGGSGYWMSRPFMDLVVANGCQDFPFEDHLVGHVLAQHGISGYHDSRYDHCSMRGGVSLHNSNITNHLWTHYNHYQQKVLGLKTWNNDWLRQEQVKELTGQWTDQDIAYMARIPALKKLWGFPDKQ